jgi:hypothetical protein
MAFAVGGSAPAGVPAGLQEDGLAAKVVTVKERSVEDTGAPPLTPALSRREREQRLRLCRGERE